MASAAWPIFYLFTRKPMSLTLQYLGTGVMKKGIGQEIFDQNVTAYDFKPTAPQSSFATTGYQYILDYDKAFGDLQLKTSRLDMLYEWIHYPEQGIYLLSDRSQSIIEEGLFHDWQLYLVFGDCGGASCGFAYLDMSIANLGIHEVIKAEYFALADKLPPMLFRSIERIE